MSRRIVVLRDQQVNPWAASRNRLERRHRRRVLAAPAAARRLAAAYERVLA